MNASAQQAPQKIAREMPKAARVRALLRMDFSWEPGSGSTVLQESYQEPPLRVVRAFSREDGSALVHLHNVSGGLLGGDQLEQQIRLGSGARVQLTTTGATRIYRNRKDYSATTQRSEIHIGEGALLEYVPDATIPFAGAQYEQQTTIYLQEGAGLFWWEILAPGREARSELFAYERLEVRTRISAAGRIVAAENFCLRPAIQNVSSLARLGTYRHAANFYMCRVGMETGAWRAAEEHFREFTATMARPGEILWGVSSLPAHGLVVRCMAHNGRDVLPGLQAVWRYAKRHLYGSDAIPPRKVN